MGGGKATMIGRVIAGQFEQAQNWTFGSAMSLLPVSYTHLTLPTSDLV